jgi:tellurite resistance protein TerC
VGNLIGPFVVDNGSFRYLTPEKTLSPKMKVGSGAHPAVRELGGGIVVGRKGIRVTVFVWLGFVLLVLAILAFDLGVFSRESKTLSAKTALFRTGVYFVLALLFTVFVYFAYQHHWFGLGLGVNPNDAGRPDSGWEAAAQFFAGYLLEQSLSVDNIFVIALILGYFKVPAEYQNRVLLWGILGALVMRGIMIAVGAALLEHFHFMNYIFGIFLFVTAIKMLLSDEDDEVDFEKNLLVRLVRRFFRVHPDFAGDKFFTWVDGKRAMTPLLLALVVVETTDLVFAVDSIPAVFGLTEDPFLVFTSNVFAILGLRSLYFALADLLGRFHLLKYSLVIILAFVGLKMLLERDFLPHNAKEVMNFVSFGLITVTLVGGVVASFLFPEKHEPENPKVDVATK